MSETAQTPHTDQGGDSMLTPAQVAHFETFGFVILRQVFNADEVSVIKREADEIFAEDKNGGPAGDTTQGVQPFFELKPYLSTLVDDDRIYEIGVDLLGPDFILLQTEGRSRVGDTSWHGPAPIENEMRTVKIGFYLDELTRDTGALRFVPGSHKPSDPDLYDLLRANNDDPEFRPFGIKPSEVACYAAETRPGDLVIFTEHTLHSSFGGSTGRQQFAINFMDDPKTDEQVAYVKSTYERWKYGLRPAESYINSDRPRIRRMVSRLVEWGFDTWAV